MSSTSAVAVFDLDGTLTRRDTLMPWLLKLSLQQPTRWLSILLGTVWAIARYSLNQDRGVLKARLIATVLAPYPKSVAVGKAHHYVAQLFADPGAWNPAVVERLREHQRLGHATVLMSASVDLYVPLIAQQLGFDQCECSELLWINDRCAPLLASDNVRGNVKTQYLQQRIKPHYSGAVLYGYGNAASDIEHLLLVEHAGFVNADSKDTRLAKARQLTLGLPPL